MTPRSWLFIPGDSERKLAKAERSGADAVIIDLEDAVLSDKKEQARRLARAFLDVRPAGSRAARLWVRINPLDEGGIGDLVAVIGGAPDGIVLPKAVGAADIVRLDHHLEALEAREGLAAGLTGIMPIATESARAALALPEIAKASLPRLRAISWGAEDLSADLGASVTRTPGGGWAFTYEWLRSLALLTARAAGAEAIDTLHADFRDAKGLAASCMRAAADGFAGKLAIHPAQVEVINNAFAPSPEAIEHARRVVKAFDAQPGTGTVALDGRMLDRPHLTLARRILEAARAHEQRR